MRMLKICKPIWLGIPFGILLAACLDAGEPATSGSWDVTGMSRDDDGSLASVALPPAETQVDGPGKSAADPSAPQVRVLGARQA